jgi:HD-GYP domain-containing protein (c-di-GMP phosphodiesterase class II)
VKNSAASIALVQGIEPWKREFWIIKTAAVLHDIGQTFIPIEIVNKPEKLTDDEFEKMKDHPLIGFELIKDVPTIGILPPHVAFQHHETQDGTGYPRRLKGDNKLLVAGASQTIHLYGSISAVADIFDAMSSDRPYRKAFPPEKVIDIMRGMSSKHLNREVLREFLSITPVYPAGCTVKVTKGKYALYSGVVTAITQENLARPTIRLVFDSKRKQIIPIELNLLENTDIEIETFIM